jgi:hypothetical protein
LIQLWDEYVRSGGSDYQGAVNLTGALSIVSFTAWLLIHFDEMKI